MTNRAPLIVTIALLLMPVLYVGSYFALVTPGEYQQLIDGSMHWPRHYRLGNAWAGYVYFPVEKLDRRIRPTMWEWEYQLHENGIRPLHAYSKRTPNP
ncbi:hypothetical protein ETAA8_07890 [Anatilimnocola aggregata]|uniref:Uncharacterized protein n=1 Tax=Anatilimnocola aggregata TaxID=2528021 RepID=A0A517Y653_9BACT|nr:hypothetical protein [Anatilimnocola aggregata]QDU25719.1 hypothetical protein ETAA8_07890 [Anatilimnocola aggregata]